MWRSKLFWIGVSFLILAALFPFQAAVIKTNQYQCYLASSHFQLSWQHSVEHQNWIEYYRYRQGKLNLYQTYLQTFGAGTPSQAKVLTDAPPGYVGYQQDIDLDELNWVVSRNMQGTILTEQQTFAIYQTLPDYSVVNIKPIRLPFITWLLGSACYG